MDKIKTVKIKNPDGSVSEETYTISVDAKDVDMINGYDLQHTIGIIDVDIDGNIVSQLKGKPYYYNTVAEMKNANLKEGDCVITLGYYEPNDGGASIYRVISSNESNNNDKYCESLKNQKYAELLCKDGYVYPEQLGATKNGIYIDITNYVSNSYSNIRGYKLRNDNYSMGSKVITTLNIIGTYESNLKILGTIGFTNLILKNLNITSSVLGLIFRPQANTMCNINIDNIKVDSPANYFIQNTFASGTTYNQVLIYNSIFENLTVSPFRLVCKGNFLKAENNIFRNLGSATSTRTSGMQLGSPTEIENCFEKVIITNNHFYNLTSIDSFGDDSSECQAVKCTVNECIITNNTVENIIGAGADHEGIYVKGQKGVISNNILTNCGEGNGAITCKPVMDLTCCGNIINSDGSGIYISARKGRISDNIIKVNNTAGRATGTHCAVSVQNDNAHDIIFENNTIEGTDLGSCIYMSYNGFIFRNNYVTAINCTRVFVLASSVGNILDITGNNFILNNTGYLVRVTSVTTNMSINLIKNNIYLGDGSSLINPGGGANAFNINFIENYIKCGENFASSNIANFTNNNANSTASFINNDIDLNNNNINGGSLIVFYGDKIKIINNNIYNGTILRLCFTGGAKSEVLVNKNYASASEFVRFGESSTIENFEFMNNFIYENTNTFTNQTAIITNAKLINNTYKTGSITSHMTVTNLINSNNNTYIN